MSIDVAVVGATGAVGETIVGVLEERALPVRRLGAFASRAYSERVRFRGDMLAVLPATAEALRDWDVVFFAGGEDASERYAPALVEGGAFVIDNSATFRMRDDVPLIVPEINPQSVRPGHRLFAVANCTAIVLCTALNAVFRAAGLRAVRVATYQAASGAGRAGLDELLRAERAVAAGGAEPVPLVFHSPLAHNVIPQIGEFDVCGDSGEERKVRDETRKIFARPDLLVSVTAVRVPVRTAHSEAVWFTTERATDVEELSLALESAPGVVFHREGIVTPRDVEGGDSVHVARLRAEHDAAGRNFALWCVGDQLRKGAATNAVQILELLLERGLLR
ncbi:MAG: aspartate-semialdehyde dehydrogenase [Candidatus Eremiobacteraeota bacterium]|nr:aspartate-semialdehyde dehydrogenase [Candidatus Eremiobacteraeota bacterium]